MQVVWFKRDLRTHDHTALVLACQRGDVLPLYILEPDLWAQPDMSQRHYVFLRECLIELYYDLRALGQGLVIKIGDPVHVLQSLHDKHGIDALWSHQETWNGFTYQRDLRVKKWTKSKQIPWYEPLQFGVIRRLTTRNQWANHWESLMYEPQKPVPLRLNTINESSQKFPTYEESGFVYDGCEFRQIGGRKEGLALLESFLMSRGEGYTKEMSSPVTAFDSCSRLSPYLAFGVLSMREVVQACVKASEQHKKQQHGTKTKWSRALHSFIGRLHWHCHFIQKLEDEPRLEFENLHYGYNGLRDFNPAYFDAWKTGHTGYPMIDACMRALIATGWLNFRMRAMLMSFASYHLWLNWREPALHLARLFTDYEPGIHYPQVQMQSGTTGINSIRVYNPIKQGIEQDPNGLFIRRWIPELNNVPVTFIHTPWIASKLMNGYPLPIVEEKIARKIATERIHFIKRQVDNFLITNHIVEKHGSRKKRKVRTYRKKKKIPAVTQTELPLQSQKN